LIGTGIHVVHFDVCYVKDDGMGQPRLKHMRQNYYTRTLTYLFCAQKAFTNEIN